MASSNASRLRRKMEAIDQQLTANPSWHDDLNFASQTIQPLVFDSTSLSQRAEYVRAVKKNPHKSALWRQYLVCLNNDRRNYIRANPNHHPHHTRMYQALQKLYERATTTIPMSASNRHSPVYTQLWLDLIALRAEDDAEDAASLFKRMKSLRIGQNIPQFWTAWADLETKLQNHDRAARFRKEAQVRSATADIPSTPAASATTSTSTRSSSLRPPRRIFNPTPTATDKKPSGPSSSRKTNPPTAGNPLLSVNHNVYQTLNASRETRQDEGNPQSLREHAEPSSSLKLTSAKSRRDPSDFASPSSTYASPEQLRSKHRDPQTETPQIFSSPPKDMSTVPSQPVKDPTNQSIDPRAMERGENVGVQMETNSLRAGRTPALVRRSGPREQQTTTQEPLKNMDTPVDQQQLAECNLASLDEQSAPAILHASSNLKPNESFQKASYSWSETGNNNEEHRSRELGAGKEGGHHQATLAFRRYPERTHFDGRSFGNSAIKGSEGHNDINVSAAIHHSGGSSRQGNGGGTPVLQHASQHNSHVNPQQLPASSLPGKVVNTEGMGRYDGLSERHAPIIEFLQAIHPDNLVTVNGKPYMILEMVGKGGSSKVFKVLSKDMKIFALKRVKVPLSASYRSTIDSYANEIDLLKKLRGYPSIIELFDAEVQRERGMIHLIMEYGDIDLAKVLLRGKGKKIDDNFRRMYWQQMLDAVHTIHEARIIHGDLKPANFMIVGGELKLIDFGIAKAIIAEDTTKILRDTQVGTPNYMSPEALMSDESEMDGDQYDDNPEGEDSGRRNSKPRRYRVGRGSDIWSLGCILYQMVYGRAPFAHIKNTLQKLSCIQDPNYEITYKQVDNILVLDVLRGCLQRDPEKRISIPQLLQHPFICPANANKSPFAMSGCDLTSSTNIFDDGRPLLHHIFGVLRRQGYEKMVIDGKTVPLRRGDATYEKVVSNIVREYGQNLQGTAGFGTETGLSGRKDRAGRAPRTPTASAITTFGGTK